MKDRKHAAWLYEQLPALVDQGIVPAETAEKLRRHYGDADPSGGRRLAVVLFGILGAALIGGGITLLLAHNWDQLSRPVRAAIAFAPLVAAQALAGWIVWTGRPGTAMREGVGTFLFLALGSCMSLVAQTYNFGGTFGQFMLTWTLLGLPVAYLMGTTLPALLYLVGIVVWTGAVWDEDWRSLAYWPLLAAVLPYFWMVARGNRYHPRPVLVGWVLAITLPVGLGLSLHQVLDAPLPWVLLYGALGSALFLAGCRWWGEATAFWQRPLQNIGALGVTGLAVALSFMDVWKAMLHQGGWAHWPDQGWWKVACGCAMAIAPVAAILLWVDRLFRRDWTAVVLGAMPLLALCGYSLASSTGSPWMGAVLFDLYLVVLGVGTLSAGIRSQRLGQVNAGMLVLAALILSRFFDADLGFVVRGIAFISLGIGFLTTNLVLMRRKGVVR